MKVFLDIFSGDELFSDAYPIKLVDDLYYEVEGKVITEKHDIDEALIGGNKATGGGGDGEESEPVEDEGVVSTATTGINVVITHKLVETSYDKKSYQQWVKPYMKRILDQLDSARADKFKSGMQKLVKEILDKIGEYRFYVGEHMDYEAMVVVQGYRADNTTPYFIYFKDGVREEKY